MRRAHIEAKPRAVLDPAWHGDADWVAKQPVAGAGACHAGIEPHFASSPAANTEPADGDVNRHDRTAARIAPRQPEFGGHGFGAGPVPEKPIARPLDEIRGRREVDRRLVGEASVAGLERIGPADLKHVVILHSSDCGSQPRDGSMACQESATDDRVAAVPEVRECPMCGGTMRLRRTETVVQIPGNPHGTTQASREWVCPDCDYFEEADGDET